MSASKLVVQYVPIASLKAAPFNPRSISRKDFDALKRSIKQHGWVEPVVVNQRSGNIVGGHMRVNAARELGHDEVPVTYVDLDYAHEVALNIALNRIHGVFDDDSLAELIADLPDDVLELTGFDDVELADLQADPFDEPESGVQRVDMSEPDKKKAAKKYTVEDLRQWGKTFYPAQYGDVIGPFLDRLEQTEAG